MADMRIEGVDELRKLARDLDLTQARTRGKAKDIVRKSAFAVERGAKLRAAVDTGAMRSSINTTLFGTALTGTSPIGAEVGPEVRYAEFVEKGTWKMAPQPFLGPAFDEVEPSFIAALEALGAEVLDG